MARPDIVAQVHEAKYELHIASLSQKAVRLAEYEKLLAEAADQFGASIPELKAAIAEDFGKWRKDEGLPPVSK